MDDLLAYDTTVGGAGTRFGRLSSQMAKPADTLRGEAAGAFTSTATQHSGQE